jgi:hypothetical protein
VATQQASYSQWTKATGKGKVLVMVEVLPPEQEDATLSQQLPKRRYGGVRKPVAGP